MIALAHLILARPLRIESSRSPASAAVRIRARVDLRSEHLTRRRCILGEVSPEWVHLAAIEPEEPDCFAPLVIGRLVSVSTTDPKGAQSKFDGRLQLSSGMRCLFPALLLLGLFLVGGSLMTLLVSPSPAAAFPLLLSIPVLCASLIALFSINERVQAGAKQLEQLLRESLEAPLQPTERPAAPPGTLLIKPKKKSPSRAEPAAAKPTAA